jgi:hypothetical protein
VARKKVVKPKSTAPAPTPPVVNVPTPIDHDSVSEPTPSSTFETSTS